MPEKSTIPVWRAIGSTPRPHGNQQIDETEILIVGGGPVGLTLALDLAQKGRRVIVANRMDFIARGSKAICFAKRTLDIWDRLGVAETMIEKGVIWNVGKVFAGDREQPLYRFDTLPVKGQKNPGFINLQQYHVETILVDALAQMPNVEIRWGHEVTVVTQNDQGVTAMIKAAGGDYTIKAQWLIACDGSKSPIRTGMGLDFEGRVFEDNFLIADIKCVEQRPSERWFWFDPPFNRGQSALLHKQPDDVWRLDFQLGWNIDRDACIRPENVEPLVRGMLGSDIEFTEEWYSVYTFQCRRMQRFVHERVVFAGDSAHLVSPFGARGCNGGVADADNLGWKLDLVVRGEAGPELIESYNDEAITTADENIANSTRSTDFMTPKSAMSVAMRDAVLELAENFPFARAFVNSGRLSTPVSYPASMLNTPDVDIWQGGVPPGSPAIDAPLEDTWLLNKTGCNFVLLSNGYNPTITGTHVIDLQLYGEDGRAAAARFALPSGGACLLRPDQYVAARWHHPDIDAIRAATVKATANAEVVYA